MVLRMSTSTEQPSEQTADLLQAVLSNLATVVGGITDAQLLHPTPCTQYDVKQLRDHIVGYSTPADAEQEVRAAADRLRQALQAGAADRPLRLGESAMPGELALGMILWEYQVHGWDLARATGQPWSPPDAAARESLSFAPGMLSDDYQGEGKPFGKPVEVPADASPLECLVALSGRDPNWQPA